MKILSKGSIPRGGEYYVGSVEIPKGAYQETLKTKNSQDKNYLALVKLMEGSQVDALIYSPEKVFFRINEDKMMEQYESLSAEDKKNFFKGDSPEDSVLFAQVKEGYATELVEPFVDIKPSKVKIEVDLYKVRLLREQLGEIMNEAFMVVNSGSHYMVATYKDKFREQEKEELRNNDPEYGDLPEYEKKEMVIPNTPYNRDIITALRDIAAYDREVISYKSKKGEQPTKEMKEKNEEALAFLSAFVVGVGSSEKKDRPKGFDVF